jgi:hypothetical protein
MSSDAVLTPFFCSTLPPIPPNEVIRDSAISTILGMFENAIEVVFVEGPHGSGTTNLLSQILRHTSQSIGLFIRTLSKWSCDPHLIAADLLDQCKMLCQASDSSPHATGNVITDFRTFVLRLSLKARKARTPIYFIIDGVDGIPDPQVKQELLELIPFGHNPFKFIVSGASTSYPSTLFSTLPQQVFHVPRFGLEESRQFLRSLGLDENAVRTVHQICRGLPSNLQAVLRLLSDSDNPHLALERLPEHLPTIFEIDWQLADRLASEDSRIVAVLALDQNAHTISSLAQLLHRTESDVCYVVDSLPFLERNTKSGAITFISENHRQFAQKKLQSLRQDVTRLIVDSLLAAPESINSLTSLPLHFKELGQLDKARDFLSAGNIAKLFNATGSWRKAYAHASLAADLAKEAARQPAEIGYQLQRACLLQTCSSDDRLSEVEAYCVLKAYDSALALANSATFDSDRLQLLAAIARRFKMQQHVLRDDILAEIQKLARELDVDELGDRAIDIAADLVYVDQDLAIDLASKALKRPALWQDSKLGMIDFAVHVLRASHTLEESDDALSRVAERMDDPSVRGFSATVEMIFGDLSADEVIARTRAKENVEREIFSLRLWCRENGRRADAARVSAHGLDRLIAATKYSPSARVYRDLATPLTFAEPSTFLVSVLDRFDSQRESARRVGPTEEYVRFETALAETRLRLNHQAAYDRLYDLYLYILDLSDVTLRCSCLGWLLALLLKVHIEPCPERDDLVRNAEADLRRTLDHLLKNTADQDDAVANLLRALAPVALTRACAVANSLNTHSRREQALAIAIRAHCTNATEVDVPTVIAAFEQIASVSVREVALMRIVERLCRSDEPSAFESHHKRLLDLIRRITQLASRARALSLFREQVTRSPSLASSTLGSEVEESILPTIRVIDADWTKVAVGFNAASSLASFSPDQAKTILELSRHVRTDTPFSNEAYADLAVKVLKLAISAHTSIAQRSVPDDPTEALILAYVQRLPSVALSCTLLADLALGYAANSRRDLCERIMAQHFRTSFATLSDEEVRLRWRVTAHAAPALYIVWPMAALDAFDKLPEDFREYSIDSVIHFLLTQRTLAEPMDTTFRYEFDCSFDTLRDSIELIGKLRRDQNIAMYVEKIADIVTSHKLRNTFSSQQKADVASRLQSIVSRSFPDPKGIAHAGYRIVCEIQLSRLSGNTAQARWDAWVEQADQLGNPADTAYVLAVVCGAIPGRYDVLRREVFSRAKRHVASLPFDLDRLERLRFLANNAAEWDQRAAKDCLREALTYLKDTSTDPFRACLRRIIDLAHRLDPEFASNLASSLDDDPSKVHAQDELDGIRTCNDILQGKTILPKSHEELMRYVASAERLHGLLNANRVAVLGFDIVSHHLEIAAKLPLEHAYRIFAWAIANMAQKYKGGYHEDKFLKPLRQEVLNAVHLVMQLQMTAQSGDLEAEIQFFTGVRRIVRPGERPVAEQHIKDWLEGNLGDHVIIVDPYFSPDDMDFLLLVRSVSAECSIEVLTSRKHNDKFRGAMSLEESYRSHWRLHVASQDIGDCTIFVIGTKDDGEAPFHDRYVLTNNAALRLGTSLNSLGRSKLSEISDVNRNDFTSIQDTINLYRQRREKQHRGKKLEYTVFSL